MSNWSPTPEPQELRELSRETAPAGTFNRRWYAAAFVIGVALVCMLGFSTDLFDFGPTSQEVSAAYRDGFDEGAAEATAYWEEELNDRWWDGYKRGQASETSMAPVLVDAVREGFSWEAGYRAGMDSEGFDIDTSYWEGWMAGYSSGWIAVTGDAQVAPFVPDPPGPGYARRVQWSEGGGEP